MINMGYWLKKMVEKWRSLQKVVMYVANGINMQTTTQKNQCWFLSEKSQS